MESCKINKVNDPTLMEKAIRALSLLEALAKSGCPFLFSADRRRTDNSEHSKQGGPLGRQTDSVCPKHHGNSIHQTKTRQRWFY